MGKWSKVRCNCLNRIPLPKSSWCDRPYRNRALKRLSSQQTREVEAWEKNIEGMYECGHRDGMLIQLCPSRIINLGFVLKKVFSDDLTFDIYPKVGNWRNYFSQNFSEELHLSPDEAELWLIEASELEAFLSLGNIAYGKIQQVIDILFYEETESDRAFKQRIQHVKETEFARVVPFLKHLDDAPISRDSILREQLTAIAETKKLCQAAIESGNPIEILW